MVLLDTHVVQIVTEPSEYDIIIDVLNEGLSTESLLKNQSSFLYGRKPAGIVPVYALTKKCTSTEANFQIRAPMSTRTPKNDQSALTLLHDNELSVQLRPDTRTSDLRAQMISQERIRQAGKTRK